MVLVGKLWLCHHGLVSLSFCPDSNKCRNKKKGEKKRSMNGYEKGIRVAGGRAHKNRQHVTLEVLKQRGFDEPSVPPLNGVHTTIIPDRPTYVPAYLQTARYRKYDQRNGLGERLEQAAWKMAQQQEMRTANARSYSGSSNRNLQHPAEFDAHHNYDTAVSNAESKQPLTHMSVGGIPIWALGLAGLGLLVIK